jgi:hypothetical protein
MDSAAYEARFTPMQRDFVVRTQNNAIDWVLSGNTPLRKAGKTGTTVQLALWKNPRASTGPFGQTVVKQE